MKEQMDAIEDIDEELTELEDMVDQLDQYTGSLRTFVPLTEPARRSSLSHSCRPIVLL